MTAVATPPVGERTAPAVMALSHAVRRTVIDCMARGLTSPVEMANDTGVALGVVSYHVRMLRDYGVLEIARSEPRRGAIKHYYRFSGQAVADLMEARDLVNSAISAARRGRAEDLNDAD